MRDYLTFILAGPVAGFGGPAGNERRPSAALPGRSAIIGILGAGLGIGREDRRRQAELTRYEVAVASLRRSSPLRDFHTVQTVPTGLARGAGSRRNALGRAAGTVHTIVTRRDYRCDVAVAVAVWGNGYWPLTSLAAALHRPVYTLSLGRRSCPPAFPLGPTIILAADPVEALRQTRPALPPDEPAGWEAEFGGEVMCWSEIPGMTPAEEVEMHSCPDDRSSWTFRPETVWIYRPAADGEEMDPCS